MGTLWINSYELFFHGKNYTELLSNSLSIDKKFTKILLKRRNLKGYEIYNKTTTNLSKTGTEEHKLALEQKYHIKEEMAEFLADQIEDMKFQSDPLIDALKDKTANYHCLNPEDIQELISPESQFVEIMKTIVSLKQGKISTFKEVFQYDEILAYMVNKIYLSLTEPSTEHYFDTLMFSPIFMTCNLPEYKLQRFNKVDMTQLPEVYGRHDRRRKQTEFQLLQTMMLFVCTNIRTAISDKAKTQQNFKDEVVYRSFVNFLESVDKIWGTLHLERVSIHDKKIDKFMPILLE